MATSSSLLIPTNAPICSTPSCIKAAQDILAGMDLNVDPCSDFYQYTCGSWQNTATVPDGLKFAGAISTLIRNNKQVRQSIMEGSYSDIIKNTLSSEGFHTDDVENDLQLFKSMQNYYQLCMNETAINALGPTPIYSDIALIENKLLPVNDTTTMFSDNDKESTIQTLGFLELRDIKSFFDADLEYDDRKPGIFKLRLRQPSQLLPKNYYTNSTKLELYRSGLNEILFRVIGEYNDGTTQDRDYRAEQSNRAGFTRWTQEKTKSAVNRFIEFDIKLAEILSAEIEIPTVYNTVALSTFQVQNSTIDWIGLFNSLIPKDGIKLGPSSNIILRSPSYFQKLNELLLSSNVTLQTIQEFLIIKLVAAKVNTLDFDSYAIYKETIEKQILGMSGAYNRRDDCMGYTAYYFPGTVGRYFVMKNFGGEVEREKVNIFTTTIREQWLHQLNYTDWLDEETKLNAIHKLNLLKTRSAYSTIAPDLRSPTSIKNSTWELIVPNVSHYDTRSIATEWIAYRRWKGVNEKGNKDRWTLYAHDVFTYYSIAGNTIDIPAGVLQAPFYSPELPEYLNYGGIGNYIGSGFTSAYNTIGRLYDGIGNLTDWWTSASNAKFDEKAQCFVDQYSNFNVTAGNQTINVNGKLTLDSNISDNGGLNTAYLAYQALQANKVMERLKGLEQFSPEELFFINYGHSSCELTQDENTIIWANTQSPVPSYNVRVNGAIQNNQDFAKVFKCPIGSPMNPEKKCKIW